MRLLQDLIVIALGLPEAERFEWARERCRDVIDVEHDIRVRHRHAQLVPEATSIVRITSQCSSYVMSMKPSSS